MNICQIQQDGTRVRLVFVEPITIPETRFASVRLFSFQGQMKTALPHTGLRTKYMTLPHTGLKTKYMTLPHTDLGTEYMINIPVEVSTLQGCYNADILPFLSKSFSSNPK